MLRGNFQLPCYAKPRRYGLDYDPSGAFLSPPSSFYGAVGTAQVQGFFLAHEMAHNLSDATYFFTNDNPAMGRLSRFYQDMNNTRLSLACY